MRSDGIKWVPSPALCVPQSDSIASCIEKMSQNRSGAVLILSDSRPREVLGIFTERDYLQKIEEIRTGNAWEKPITWVMRKPVITLQSQDIHQAADVMFIHHVRNLPVLEDGTQSSHPVAGILTMDQIFETLITNRPVPESRSKTPGQPQNTEIAWITSHSNSPSYPVFQVPGVRLTPFQFDEITSTVFETLLAKKMVIFEIDGIPVESWAGFLKKLLHSRVETKFDKEIQVLFLFYSPTSHPERSVKILEKLSKAKNLFVFQKPIPILKVLKKIRDGLKSV